MWNKKTFVAALLVFSVAGSLQAADAPKYDMSKFKVIVEDTAKLVKSGDYAAAQKKIMDLEGLWDEGTKELKAADRKVWTVIDKQMDASIEAVKGAKDAASAEKAEKSLAEFLAKLSLAEAVK